MAVSQAPTNTNPNGVPGVKPDVRIVDLPDSQTATQPLTKDDKVPVYGFGDDDTYGTSIEHLGELLGAGGDKFPADAPPVGQPFFSLPAGTEVAGRDIAEVLGEAWAPLYQYPGFSFFYIGGNGGTLYREVGTAVPAGFKSFTWGTSNPDNIELDSIVIRDVTANTILADDQANDGTASASTAAFTVVPGESRRYRISAVNTNQDTFTADIAYIGAYYIFYGPTSAPSASSAAVRALPASRLTTEGSQFILNTGTTATVFEINAPVGVTVSVIDLDALNATMPYTAAALTMQDAGNADYASNTWRLTIADPYSANHRHQVTLS